MENFYDKVIKCSEQILKNLTKMKNEFSELGYIITARHDFCEEQFVKEAEKYILIKNGEQIKWQ